MRRPNRSRSRSAIASLVIAALVAMTTACGYSLAGRGAFLPAYIRTIGIPMFVNSTNFFEVEQVLTQKVRSEFIGRGKYTILPEATGADGVLVGHISSITIAPASFTSEQQASRYVITMTTSIQFRDVRSNKVLWENPSLVFREEYEVASGTSAVDPAAFFGQQSNALERVSTDFARTVVSAILEAF